MFELRPLKPWADFLVISVEYGGFIIGRFYGAWFMTLLNLAPFAVCGGDIDDAWALYNLFTGSVFLVLKLELVLD